MSTINILDFPTSTCRQTKTWNSSPHSWQLLLRTTDAVSDVAIRHSYLEKLIRILSASILELQRTWTPCPGSRCIISSNAFVAKQNDPRLPSQEAKSLETDQTIATVNCVDVIAFIKGAHPKVTNEERDKGRQEANHSLSLLEHRI
jgi:hypothetical protein